MSDDSKEPKKLRERSPKRSAKKTSSWDSSSSRLDASGHKPRRSVKRNSTTGNMRRNGDPKTAAAAGISALAHPNERSSGRSKSQTDPIPRVSRRGKSPKTSRESQSQQPIPKGSTSSSSKSRRKACGERRKAPLRSSTLEDLTPAAALMGSSISPKRRAKRKPSHHPSKTNGNKHEEPVAFGDHDTVTTDSTTSGATSSSDQHPTPADLAEEAARLQQESLHELSLHSSSSSLHWTDCDPAAASPMSPADAAEAAAHMQRQTVEELSQSFAQSDGGSVDHVVEELLRTSSTERVERTPSTQRQSKATQKQQPNTSGESRRIRFHDDITEQTAITVTVAERELVWYKGKDLDQLMLTELQKLNKQKIKGKQADVCWRGLEHLANGKDERKQKNAALVQLALQFQRDMKLESIDDPEALRTLCRSKTMGDRKRAFTRGTLDATELMNMELEAAVALTTQPPPAKPKKIKDQGFIKAMTTSSSGSSRSSIHFKWK